MAPSPSPARYSAAAHRSLNIALWGAQAVLAFVFAWSGFLKTTLPIGALVQNGLAWTADVPLWLVRFIGIAELAGSAGLILPAAARIRPDLTPLAALGLLAIMVLGMAFHIVRGEPQPLPLHIVLGGIAAFVAWGRATKAPNPPR